MPNGSSNVDPNSLQDLSSRLSSPAFRRSFAADPQAALERAGLDVQNLTPEVVDALADLSPQELAVLADVKQRAGVDEAGFTGGVIF